MNANAGKRRTAEPVSETGTANLPAALAGADLHDEAAMPRKPYKAELHGRQEQEDHAARPRHHLRIHSRMFE